MSKCGLLCYWEKACGFKQQLLGCLYCHRYWPSFLVYCQGTKWHNTDFKGNYNEMGTSFHLKFLWTGFRMDRGTNSSLMPESYFLNPWAKYSKSKWAGKVAGVSGARDLLVWSQSKLLFGTWMQKVEHVKAVAEHKGVSGHPEGSGEACEKPLVWLPKSELPKWEQCVLPRDMWFLW